MIEIIQRIRDLESRVYPSHMQQLHDVEDWSDLQDYCEHRKVKVVVLGDCEGYILMTPKEVVDIVSTNPRLLYGALEHIRQYYKKRWFRADFRESTSYRLVLAGKRRGIIEVKRESRWDWDGETMFQCQLRFT